MHGEDITQLFSLTGLNLWQAGPRVPQPLAVLVQASRGGGGAPDGLAGPCPGLPPTTHLGQVPQGLLQPLSVLCVQGGLLLELQGFLAWW